MERFLSKSPSDLVVSWIHDLISAKVILMCILNLQGLVLGRSQSAVLVPWISGKISAYAVLIIEAALDTWNRWSNFC